MAMNLLHRVLCRSTIWSRPVERELLPLALDGVDLGARAVEIGAGYGANLGFRLIHVGDVYNPVDPDLLTGRLEQVGFTGIAVDVRGRHLRFRARKRG